MAIDLPEVVRAALGTAIAALTNAGILLVLLGRRLEGLEGSKTADCFLRILLAAGVMGVAVQATDRWFATHWPDSGLLVSLLALGAEITLGVTILATAARLLRITEFNLVKDRLLTALSRIRLR